MKASTREQVESASKRGMDETKIKAVQLTLRPERETEEDAAQAAERAQKKTGEIKRDTMR